MDSRQWGHWPFRVMSKASWILGFRHRTEEDTLERGHRWLNRASLASGSGSPQGCFLPAPTAGISPLSATGKDRNNREKTYSAGSMRFDTDDVVDVYRLATWGISPMHRPSRRTFAAVCTAAALAGASVSPANAAPPSLLKLFGKAKPIDEADSFILSQEDGPWLLMATHFVGEDAKNRAQRTALEIRNKLRLPAFIYEEDFNFTGTAGEDRSTGRRARYANPHKYQAYAVLVGEYDSVNHGNIERDLERLKSADLDVFRDPDEVAAEFNTKTPASMVKTFGQQLFKTRKGRGRSPLGNAFVTRNPMLDDSWFQRPEVDSFVRQLNEDLPHTLLKADGNFTVVVRTFSACGTVVGAKNQDKFEPSEDRMDSYAKQADKMVRALRKQGEEAYQFHDRNRSLVTIGTFESLGRDLPGGGFQYAPEIRRVMRQYSAFNATQANPNSARQVPGRRGVAANHIAMIPFDVQPTPIAIPKVGKRSLYSAMR